MDFGTLLEIATPIVSAFLGSKAASKAADRASAGVAQASALQRQQFEQTRADLEPWRKAGVNALRWLTDLSTPGALPGDTVGSYLTGLPGYRFAEGELQKAIDRRHAATGNRMSGRGYKEMTRWMNENLVQPSYRNWLSELATLAGYGREGNRLVASLGANTAANLGNLNLQGANIGAEAAAAPYLLWNNALQNVSSAIAPNAQQRAYDALLRSLMPT